MVYVHRKVAFTTIIPVSPAQGGVKFLPGMNTISDGEMKKIEDSPRGKKIFGEECKFNMIIGGTVESNTFNAAESGTDMRIRAAEIAKEVSSVNVTKAIEIISKIGDGYVLRALKKIEGRKGIQLAIDNRMDDIASQKGSDLTPESRLAPDGDGSDFLDNVGGGQDAKNGTKGHSAVPALNKNKRQ